MDTGSNKLTEILKELEENPPCPHLLNQKNGGTRVVPGSGNPCARVIFVGEAPGAEEDRLGIPFVGRSGQLLNKLLAEIGLKREDVYITNIVKIRPPENRDPTEKEKAQFKELLYREIEAIHPSIICTLGRHSTGSLLGKGPHKRGEPQKTPVGWVIPMFHPAAALYNPNKLPEIREQFNTLKNWLQKTQLETRTEIKEKVQR